MKNFLSIIFIYLLLSSNTTQLSDKLKKYFKEFAYGILLVEVALVFISVVF